MLTCVIIAGSEILAYSLFIYSDSSPKRVIRVDGYMKLFKYS